MLSFDSFKLASLLLERWVDRRLLTNILDRSDGVLEGHEGRWYGLFMINLCDG